MKLQQFHFTTRDLGRFLINSNRTYIFGEKAREYTTSLNVVFAFSQNRRSPRPSLNLSGANFHRVSRGFVRHFFEYIYRTKKLQVLNMTILLASNRNLRPLLRMFCQ